MRGPGTLPGQELSPLDKENVEEIRKKIGNLLPSRFDTDFNIYRFILNADKSHKGRDTLGVAEQHIRNHIRYRKSLRLDTEPVPNWHENPIHQQQLLPKGSIRGTDKCNRIVWINEYRTIQMEGLMHTLRSSEMLVYHFWLYEEMLRLVNEQEAKTGRLSGIHCIVDLEGYPMNPFSMIFVSSGSMGYYTHLFHYEHYPELVSPTDLVNAAKWMSVPYKVIKGIMPQGFTDRFRVHDSHYEDHLKREVHSEHLPDFLGGDNPDLKSIPARMITREEHWKPSEEDPDPKDLRHIMVAPRRRKIIPVEILRPNTNLTWYFTTDAELHFGIFFTRIIGLDSNESENDNCFHKKDIDRMEMVEPWFRLAGRLVPEQGELLCQRPGLYYVIFCNKNAWLTRRNIRIRLETETPVKKQLLDRTFSL